MPETQYFNQWGNQPQQQPGMQPQMQAGMQPQMPQQPMQSGMQPQMQPGMPQMPQQPGMPMQSAPDFSNYNTMSVTIFDGIRQPVTYLLSNFQKGIITFGRAPGNDIVFYSPIVSSLHGRFIFINGRWYIEDRAVFGGQPSKNGLIYNNSYLTSRMISEGDFVRIDDGVQTIADGVLFIFSSNSQDKRWNMMQLNGINEIRIGRDPNCQVVFPHISVSRLHARIVRTNQGFFLYDNNSRNGVVVNNQRVKGAVQLNEKDVIVIANNKLIFTSNLLFFVTFNSGISVDADNILIARGSGKNQFIMPHAVDINIRPGELIAIVGCSGAGKSTIMNCMSGYLQPVQGTVSINGTNLYENFDSLKEIIGYVPQADIVYDNLSVYDMLSYTAKMRLPKELTDAERDAAVKRAIQMVDLQEHQQRLIKKLSGGQKKRASIAVELLSDPSLLFLDEPASGLDPGTEKLLMESLRKMADGGKTVILVTHSVLQLQMCDRIIFMGKGGRLCFFGSYEESLRFFGISDIVDVYNVLSNDPESCWLRYSAQKPQMRSRTVAGSATIPRRQKSSQIPVLFSRYMKLLMNDRQRAIIMFAQAPLLAILISLVKGSDPFTAAGASDTKSLLFALSCAAFWIGMYNSIQEICKERNIVKREFMAGMSLTSYLLSKIYALAVICAIQSFLLNGVFCILVGTTQGLMLPSAIEMFFTAFLTAFSASAIGLLVSALFTNPDRALTMAPLLLLPQILFSGLIFKVKGVTEFISWFVVCRWSMEGFGSSANLNELYEGMYRSLGRSREFVEEAAYKFESGHIMLVWFIMIVIAAASFFISLKALSSLAKDKS
ncbi:MAG: ATP-binding cassette domain-containing protein [Clostridiales bacterium]|nr:ATP-binding cassette domain-containing protein [Clostridiales bacterium]